MREVNVDLGARAYIIYIGGGIRSKKHLFHESINSRQIMVVTNETIAPLYLSDIKDSLSDFNVSSLILADGEQHKNLQVVNYIITELLRLRFGRDSCLVALGGGVIGDIVGFTAACYQRGIDFINIPTTVLAQVDSSVGGKTGVNHPEGKNMIGAFHQPLAVIADTSTLSTLSKREVSAGIAEVIKYGLIRDTDFFVWIENNIDQVLAGDPQAMAYIVERSCWNKADIVAQDERESGIRAILNFGHTFAHAIETGLGYGTWLHGEAVSLGMLMASDLSYRLGWVPDDVVVRISELLHKSNLPVRLPKSLKPAKMRELMSVDKKTKNGQLFLILLEDIGKAVITNKFDENLLLETLHNFY